MLGSPWNNWTYRDTALGSPWNITEPTQTLLGSPWNITEGWPCRQTVSPRRTELRCDKQECQDSLTRTLIWMQLYFFPEFTGSTNLAHGKKKQTHCNMFVTVHAICPWWRRMIHIVCYYIRSYNYIYIHIHRSMKQRVVLMRVPKVKLNFCYVWTAATAIPSISPANICHWHQLIGGRAKPTRNSVQPYCNDPQTRNNAFPTKADSALATGVYLYAGTYLPINLPNLCRASVQSHLSTFTIRDSSQATNYMYYT